MATLESPVPKNSVECKSNFDNQAFDNKTDSDVQLRKSSFESDDQLFTSVLKLEPQPMDGKIDIEDQPLASKIVFEEQLVANRLQLDAEFPESKFDAHHQYTTEVNPFMVSCILEETISVSNGNNEFLPIICESDENGLSPCKSHRNVLPDEVQSYKCSHLQTIFALKTECDKAYSEVNSMKIVITEYENAMKKMITELQALRSSRANEELVLMNKRLLKESSALEQSYSDLKSRYEDMKTINDGIRKTEELQRQTITALEGDISRGEQKYESLRQLAEQKIAEVNNDMARIRHEAEKEASALKAKITRVELTVKSMDALIESKTRENKELMSICDDLILKMDSKN